MKRVNYRFAHILCAFLLFALILLVDFFSKKWALRSISPVTSATFPYGGVPIFQNLFGINFSLNLVFNRGSAWGMFSTVPHALIVVRFLILSGLLFYILFLNHSKKYLFPLCAIVAGAVGNLMDAFLYRRVIDFFHFTFWGYDFPVFNCADSAIFCGVLFIFLSGIRFRRHLET